MSIAQITQILTAREELIVAIESGYVDRAEVEDELNLYDQVLAAA